MNRIGIRRTYNEYQTNRISIHHIRNLRVFSDTDYYSVMQ
jgi:hypothetical protein